MTNKSVRYAGWRKLTILSLATNFCLVLSALTPWISTAAATDMWPMLVPVQGNTITFDPPNPSVLPGEKVVITAKVRNSVGVEIPGASVSWQPVGKPFEDYVQIVSSGNTITVIGLNGPTGATTRPTAVPIAAIYTPPAGGGAVAAAIAGVVAVTLAGTTPPGPIPPGLTPQVDVMWSVLPTNIVHDNFGSKIRDEYYGIAVVIGNNSGYNLQIASVGFTVPKLPHAGGGKYIIPSANYQMTRGSLLRQQQVGLRNKIANTINAFGPLFTGFLPYFRVASHRTNFSQFINIFSNPFEKGFELVAPDTTVGHLVRLDQQAFKNDSTNVRTIVENNTHYATITFFPKGFLKEYFALNKINKNDPMEVMAALGDIVLVGEQVQYVNRISLGGTPIPPPTADFSISGQVAEAGCPGGGIPQVDVTLSGGASFTARTTKTDLNGNYRFDNVPSGSSYTVTPAPKAGVTFPTPSQTFTLIADKSDADFAATLTTYIIRGRVIDVGTGAGLAGVVLTLSGVGPAVTATSDSNGNYLFENITAGGPYNVTPPIALPAGITSFSPASLGPLNLVGGCHQQQTDFRAFH